MTTQERDEIEAGRKNPDCYDDRGAYVGPGAELYDSTQTVDADGEPIARVGQKIN